MTDIAMDLKDRVTSKLDEHEFVPLYSMPFGTRLWRWYKKRSDYTKEDSSPGASESEESKNAELQPSFEIEYSSLQYSSAARNYQPKTARKRVVHTFLVNMVILFFAVGSFFGKLFGSIAWLHKLQSRREHQYKLPLTAKRNEKYFSCIYRGTKNSR